MTNVYDLIDRELDRLHKLLALAIERNSRGVQYSGYNHSDPEREIWDRIVALEKMLMDSYQANDKLLQERIADLALVGSSEKKS